MDICWTYKLDIVEHNILMKIEFVEGGNRDSYNPIS